MERNVSAQYNTPEFINPDLPFADVKEYFEMAQLVLSQANLTEINSQELRFDELAKIFRARLQASLNSGSQLGICTIMRKYNLSEAEGLMLSYLVFEHLRDGLRRNSTASLVALMQKIGIGTALDNFTALLNTQKPLYANDLISFDGRDGVLATASVVATVLEIPIRQENEAKLSKQPSVTITKSPRDLVAEMDKFIIGQTQAKRVLATGVFEHLTKVALRDRTGKKYAKSNIMIAGPSGSGKTYMCEVLAKALNVPVFFYDATNYTETGYIGSSAGDIILDIKSRTKTSGRIIPPCIAVIDEIDKIAIRMSLGHSTDRDVSGKSVQEELLRLLEADTAMVEVRSFGTRTGDTYDIRNVLFVTLGAFSDIADFVKSDKKDIGIGFNKTAKAKTSTPDLLTMKTIQEYGFMPEFLGRFTHFAKTEQLGKPELIEILTKAQDNIISQATEVLSHCGIDFEAKQEIIEHLADEAITKGTGARGLNQAFSVTVSELLFEHALAPDLDASLAEITISEA